MNRSDNKAVNLSSRCCLGLTILFWSIRTLANLLYFWAHAWVRIYKILGSVEIALFHFISVHSCADDIRRLRTSASQIENLQTKIWNTSNTLPKQLSLSQKLHVTDEAAETGNVKKPLQNGISTYPRFSNGENIENIPRKLTIHPGAKAQAIELDIQLHDSMNELRRAELAVSTSEIIDKAFSIDHEFKNGNSTRLQN